MVVPLKSGEQVQGAMAVWRSGGQPFEAHELAFLEGLSQQAVIALNNARLFDETQAALQRQTASAEILRVISQSPNDVMPVAEVDRRARPGGCSGCDRTAFLRREGETLDSLRHATASGTVPGVVGRIPLDPAHNFPSRALVSRRTAAHPGLVGRSTCLRTSRPSHRVTGCRSSLLLPLLRGEEGLGVLIFQRDEPEPFSDADIALAQSFADQAVIAIENVRLFNETREALERQTATAEVLQVIGSSMADPKPVFEKIVECCERLFDARTFGVAIVGDDGQLSMEVIRMTASARAEIGADKADAIVARTLAAFPRPLAGTLTEKAIRKGDLVEIRDLQNDPDRSSPPHSRRGEIGLGTSASSRRSCGRVAASGR